MFVGSCAACKLLPQNSSGWYFGWRAKLLLGVVCFVTTLLHALVSREMDLALFSLGAAVGWSGWALEERRILHQKLNRDA